MNLKTTIALLCCVAMLASCGRRGDPLKPSEAAIAQAKKENRPVPDAPTPNGENPEKRFILDGLLE